MILVDVNVIVYASRREFANHEVARFWLEEALVGDEPVAVTDMILSSVVRLITNHRVLPDPFRADEALLVCEAVKGAPASVKPVSSPGRWKAFARLTKDLGLRANDIPDAFLAATAIDLGARLATFDQGFRRFTGLSVLVPGQG